MTLTRTFAPIAIVVALLGAGGCKKSMDTEVASYKSAKDRLDALAAKSPLMKADINAKVASFDKELADAQAKGGDDGLKLIRELVARMQKYETEIAGMSGEVARFKEAKDRIEVLGTKNPAMKTDLVVKLAEFEKELQAAESKGGAEGARMVTTLVARMEKYVAELGGLSAMPPGMNPAMMPTPGMQAAPGGKLGGGLPLPAPMPMGHPTPLPAPGGKLGGGLPPSPPPAAPPPPSGSSGFGGQ